MKPYKSVLEWQISKNIYELAPFFLGGAIRISGLLHIYLIGTKVPHSAFCIQLLVLKRKQYILFLMK